MNTLVPFWLLLPSTGGCIPILSSKVPNHLILRNFGIIPSYTSTCETRKVHVTWRMGRYPMNLLLTKRQALIQLYSQSFVSFPRDNSMGFHLAIDSLTPLCLYHQNDVDDLLRG